MLATIFNFPNILITQQKVMNVYQQEIINCQRQVNLINHTSNNLQYKKGYCFFFLQKEE
jgi:hypothetical protein